MYSIILSDEVVDATDKAAYKSGTSRSGLIDRILAEYLSCPIPEMRIEDTFSRMEKMLSGLDTFHLKYRPHCSVFAVQSALRYRYKPTIRYTLELYKHFDNSIGELRVSLRTQNQALIYTLTDFFNIWDEIENKVIGHKFSEGRVPCFMADGKYIRKLSIPEKKENRTNEKIADAISSYICEFDSILKLYFGSGEDSEETVGMLETQYRNDIARLIII